jgi:hypothetical protein
VTEQAREGKDPERGEAFEEGEDRGEVVALLLDQVDIASVPSAMRE